MSRADRAAGTRAEPSNRSGVRRPARRRSVPASVALHATMLLAVAVAVFPIVWVSLTSLKSGDRWSHPEDFSNLGIDNYRRVLRETEFLQWMLNSVVVALGTTALGVFIAASAGYAVSRMRFPGRASLMWTFLVVQMFPVAVLIVPLYTIMSSLRLLDTYGGLILVYCTVAMPFCAWMLKGYFDTIPIEIDEAGRVDGLSPFGTFWRLILPLAKPGIGVTAFYSFLTAWGEVAYANQFMLSEDKYTLAVGLRTFVGQFKSEWGLMSASSVLIAVPAGIVFLLVQRHLQAGLTAGSTKA